jgi:flagellum-specific peptidoglycan hydrolase FlgJ
MRFTFVTMKKLRDGLIDILRFFFVGETGRFSYTAAFAAYGLYVVHITVRSWQETGTLDAVWAEWTVWVIPFLLGMRPAQKVLNNSPIGSFVSRYLAKKEEVVTPVNPKEKMGNPQPTTPLSSQDKFVADNFNAVKAIETKYGIDRHFVLAMAACESGFGKSGIGNKKYNLWGIKAGKSWKGEKVLVTTTEYSKRANLKFPEIISREYDAKKGMYKYRVKDWFRSYDSFDQAIEDWINNVLKNKNFLPAWPARGNARQYIAAIQNCKYKYATAPNYVNTIHNFITVAENIIKKLNLK